MYVSIYLCMSVFVLLVNVRCCAHASKNKPDRFQNNATLSRNIDHLIARMRIFVRENNEFKRHVSVISVKKANNTE